MREEEFNRTIPVWVKEVQRFKESMNKSGYWHKQRLPDGWPWGRGA
jgi:hypothetical protein